MRILVVNTGSSSLKLRLLDDDDRLLGARDLAAPRAEVDGAELAGALADLGQPDAAGHRIVHGGERFRDPVRLDAGVLRDLEEFSELAPLHQGKSLAAVAAVGRALPDVPAVACFDNAFHATLPEAAATYALPAAWRERWPLRRYGFHGLSHAYVARRAAEMLGKSAEALRTVSCHLGAGASLAAIAGGVSVDTTMGFTPLEGLVMATRSGSVDPGLLLWLLEHGSMGEREMAAALEHESGLVGLAGTGEMSEVVAAAEDGRASARLALDVYTHRVRAGIAAMAAALGGIDCLAFTGGVGENSPVTRAAVGDGLGFLGIRIDAERNEAASTDREIGTDDAAVRSLVIETREDLEISRQVRLVLD